MRVKCDNAHDEPTFQIANKCLMLVEGPEVPSASNVRQKLEVALLRKYQTTPDYFLKNNAMVTDSAAVIERVANASVSADLHSPDETWMGCMAHFSNNVMNHSIPTCNRDSTLRIVAADFSSMKRIVENANRNGCNQYLPDGFT